MESANEDATSTWRCHISQVVVTSFEYIWMNLRHFKTHLIHWSYNSISQSFALTPPLVLPPSKSGTVAGVAGCQVMLPQLRKYPRTYMLSSHCLWLRPFRSRCGRFDMAGFFDVSNGLPQFPARKPWLANRHTTRFAASCFDGCFAVSTSWAPWNS